MWVSLMTCGQPATNPASQMREARLLADLTTSEQPDNSPGHSKCSSEGSYDSDSGKRTCSAPPALNLVTSILPLGFPTVEEALLSSDIIDESSLRALFADFTDFATQAIKAFRSSKYEKLETAIRTFYSRNPHVDLLGDAVVASLMLRGETLVYDACLKVLQERLAAPLDLQQFSILRQLSDSIESIVNESLHPFGLHMACTGAKAELAARFGHLLGLHLGICQSGSLAVMC